jgi:hypothetical protein
MWNLQENASAVAGLRIASASAAVRQVEQHLDSLAHNFVTFVAANVGDKSDPTRIVLLRRMVQALGGRGGIRFFPMRRHGHVCSIAFVCGLPGRFGMSCS